EENDSVSAQVLASQLIQPFRLPLLRLERPEERPAPRGGVGLPLQEPAEGREPVAGPPPAGHQLPERSVQIAPREAGLRAELVREQRAALLEQREEESGPVTQRLARPTGRVQQPRQILAPHQRDGRGASRRGPARRLIRARQPSPGDLAREAELVEQRPVIAGQPRRQHVALPGGRRGLEPLQLPDDLRQPLRAVQLRSRVHVLPAEQEAEEVLRGGRLDLPPQPPQREAVDARQERALAPLRLAGAL